VNRGGIAPCDDARSESVTTFINTLPVIVRLQAAHIDLSPGRPAELVADRPELALLEFADRDSAPAIRGADHRRVHQLEDRAGTPTNWAPSRSADRPLNGLPFARSRVVLSLEIDFLGG
jgi:hypothetical protein